VALLTDLDPTANACLHWEPDQAGGPAAITPPGSDGSRPCGCFVLFVPAQKEDEVRLFEYGMSLLFTDRSWKAVQKALQKDRTLSLSTGGDGSSVSVV
jgi:hypothetical protein